MTEDKFDADKELQRIKVMLKNAKDDVEGVGEDTGATLRHGGRWTKDKASKLYNDIDERLARAVKRTEEEAETAPPEEAEKYTMMAAGMKSLHGNLSTEYSAIGDGTPDARTAEAIDGFHSEVDGYLERMRKSGREW
jgi:hypothetical protein